MTNAAQTYAELFKLASASAEVQAVKKLAGVSNVLSKAHALGLLGLGGLAAGVPAYMIGKSRGEGTANDHLARTRNLSFGAGVASGLVAPPLLKTIGRATGLGLTPGDGGEEYTSI